MTPLVVTKRKGESNWFYTAKEFEDWCTGRDDLKTWSIEYKKGLASLEDAEYEQIIKNPNMFAIEGGVDLKSTLDAWFASDPAIRKEKIMGTQTAEESE
jgi:hypothetical protein